MEVVYNIYIPNFSTHVKSVEDNDKMVKTDIDAFTHMSQHNAYRGNYYYLVSP